MTCRPLPVRLSRVVWGVVLRTHRRQATLVCLIALGLAAMVVVAGPAAGEPPQIAAKRAEAQRVLGEIQSLDSQLEQAVEAYNGATEDLTRIEADRALNTRHLSIAKNNLVVAQRRLGDRIRAMYTAAAGRLDARDPARLALNLTEFLDSVETANSVASQDTQVVGEIKKFKHDVTVRAAFLKKAQARQEQIVSQRAAAKQEIESGLAERQRLLESIKGEIVQARGGRAGAPGAARRRGAAAAPGRAIRTEGGGAAGPAVRHGRRRRLRDHAGRRVGRAPVPLRRSRRDRNAVPRHARTSGVAPRPAASTAPGS